MIKWDLIARSKEKGGLGIKDKMSKSLLVKWWWKLESKEGLWQKIVQAKYIKGRPISCIDPRQLDFPCWNELLRVRNYYIENRSMKIGNGEATSFWDDAWCSSRALKYIFPDLFAICNQ
jgi:hypothetical protein